MRPEDDLISKCGPNVEKTVSFDDAVHFIDEENMVTYVDFDCGITLLPETPTKIRHATANRITFPDPVKNPNAIPAMINIPVLLMSSIPLITSKICLNPYKLLDMVPAALMSLSHTNDTYSMFNQYPQPTTQQHRTYSNPVFSSLRTMDSKRKGLRVSLAFFQGNYLQDGRVNETVATVEKLIDLWKPGAMDGVPPFLMNCNCF